VCDQVSYRIGEDGSVGVIYDGRAPSTVSEDSSGSSVSSDDVSLAPASTHHRLTPSPDATAMSTSADSAVSYGFLSSVIVAKAS